MMNSWKSSLFCPREQRVLWTRWDMRAPLSLSSRVTTNRQGNPAPSLFISRRCRSWSPLKKSRSGRRER